MFFETIHHITLEEVMFLFDLLAAVYQVVCQSLTAIYQWQVGLFGVNYASFGEIGGTTFVFSGVGLVLAFIITFGACDDIYAFYKKRHYRYLTYLASCFALFFTVMHFWPPIAALYILISVVLDGPRTVRNAFSRISKAISVCCSFFGKVIRNPKLNGNEA